MLLHVTVNKTRRWLDNRRTKSSVVSLFAVFDEIHGHRVMESDCRHFETLMLGGTTSCHCVIVLKKLAQHMPRGEIRLSIKEGPSSDNAASRDGG